MGKRRLEKLPSAFVALAAFAAVGYAFTRALEAWRMRATLLASDPSAAELFLDAAEVWAAGGAAALVIGAAAARLALRR